MRSNNPVLRESVLQRARDAASESPMTVDGTIMKIALLLLAVVGAATVTWKMVAINDGAVVPVMAGAGIGALLVSIVLCFKPMWAPYLALPFAGLEGLVLGAVSAWYQQAFPAQEVGGMVIGGSIVFQAVLGTMAVSVTMLGLYALRIVKVTARVRAIALAGFGAVFLVYLATMILGFFGVGIPYIHDSGPIGIGFSLLVIGVMAFNLLVDFDFIERGANGQLPKAFEWYGAFAVLVTLIWMYLEMLRLLAKLRSSD